MNILEYERRVKKFAHPSNSGKVSVRQLKEAFAGTEIFDQLGNRKSIIHKLICSPFFKNLKLSHNQKNQHWFEE